MKMELGEHAEPEQTGVGKDQNAATHVILIGDAWDFMNMGIEVGSNPEVEISRPPSWTNYEEHCSEGGVIVVETIASGREDRSEVLPLYMLWARLWQSKFNTKE